MLKVFAAALLFFLFGTLLIGVLLQLMPKNGWTYFIMIN